MSNRSTVPNSLDDKIFRNTASTTKKINVEPKIMRGGTRL